MNIIIEKDAAEYIKSHSKDNSVLLYIKAGNGGWCAVQSPTVQLGKPQKVENFDLYVVDDTNVYMRKGSKAINDKLHIFIRKFLWIKELAVDGMSINY